MSAATRANSARKRARIALEMIVKVSQGKCRNLYRAYDDCFEMNDGDEVIEHGYRSLARSVRYRQAVLGDGGYFAPVKWVERARVLEGRTGNTVQLA